jgi:hypothetical protein
MAQRSARGSIRPQLAIQWRPHLRGQPHPLGGYLQWLTERECFDSARALADGDCHLAETGLSAERLLNIITLRLGQLVMYWDIPTEEGVSESAAFAKTQKKARILLGISRSVLAIHRIQSQSPRQKSESRAFSEPSGRGAHRQAQGLEQAKRVETAGGGQERGEPPHSRAASEAIATPSGQRQLEIPLGDN